MSAPLEYEDEAVRRTGDRAPDEQDVLLGVHAGDHEVLAGERLAAHAAGEALALDDTRRVRRRADRAGLAAHRRAVRGMAALEAVTLDDAREAAALRGSLDVDVLALLEHGRSQRLSKGVCRDVRDTKFLQMPRRREVALRELPEDGLREALLLVRTEAELE